MSSTFISPASRPYLFSPAGEAYAESIHSEGLEEWSEQLRAPVEEQYIVEEGREEEEMRVPKNSD